jgi:hemolysin D
MNVHVEGPVQAPERDTALNGLRLKLDVRQRARALTTASPRPRREDQAFLPADLEILETPPSPIRMSLILLICSLVVVALAWSWFGQIEIISVAQGKIQPAGRVKLVQSLEAGKVAAIMVRNGQSVRAGDPLIALDRADAEADDQTALADLASSRAEAIRRRTALSVATENTFATPPQIAWDDDIPPAVRHREERVLTSDLAQLASSIASLDAQVHQKQVERDRLDETITSQRELLKTLKERVDMRSTLVTAAGGSRSNVIDSLESLQTQAITLTTQLNQRDVAIANLDVLARERDKTIKSFIEDNGQKLAEAERQAEDLTQKLVKARLRIARMTLTSPIDGTVAGLNITTVGQVITVGEEAMRIVPDDAVLEVEGYLTNTDIGFVHDGQKAVLKVDSFPFTRYGTIPAQVVRVGQDAIPEPDALQRESTSLQPQKSSLFPGAERVQNLVFPVTLRLEKTAMTVDGESIPLRSGMSVKIEIATGKRRILGYILSPLLETTSTAARER